MLAGGSGGHIFPAIAVADKILEKQPNSKILFICSKNHLDKNILIKNKKKFRSIFSGKLRRYFSLKNFTDPVFMIIGFFQSFFILIKFKPDVIFSKGGFVSLFPILAAWILKIPIITHESDSVSGLANNICNKFANIKMSAFKKKGFKFVGLPLRINKDPIKIKLFNNNKKNIFLFFGSQGSVLINNLFIKIIEKITENFNVIWIYGNDDEKKFNPLTNIPNIKFYKFLHEDFFNILNSSDLIISRSGSSIFEIAFLEKPSILIPLTSSAGNHQWKNAENFHKNQACIMLDERELTPEILLNTIIKTMNNKKLKKLSENTKKIQIKDAADLIANKILEFSHD